MTRDQIIEAARSWIGTPWHHQARLKGVGVDCVGLIVGVCQEMGISVQDTTDYRRFPDGVTLAKELERQLVKTAEPLPGDVLLFRVTRLPQHVAFCSPLGMIHAHQGSKNVVETAISPAWRTRLIGIYSLPGIA
jgi:NlpC/P60 family putative phage cell wall peptidase